MKLIATKGLPGSGKSTWAKEYQAQYPIGTVAIVNNDSIQEMMFGQSYVDAPNIPMMLAVSRFALVESLSRFVDVIIIDNTNLSRSAVRQLNNIADQFAEDHRIEWKDFTYVPIKVCLERNRLRDNPVPEDVIYSMAHLLRKE